MYVAALHQNDDSRTVRTTLYFADADEFRTTTHDMLSLDILNLQAIQEYTRERIREAIEEDEVDPDETWEKHGS